MTLATFEAPLDLAGLAMNNVLLLGLPRQVKILCRNLPWKMQPALAVGTKGPELLVQLTVAIPLGTSGTLKIPSIENREHRDTGVSSPR